MSYRSTGTCICVYVVGSLGHARPGHRPVRPRHSRVKRPKNKIQEEKETKNEKGREERERTSEGYGGGKEIKGKMERAFSDPRLLRNSRCSKAGWIMRASGEGGVGGGCRAGRMKELPFDIETILSIKMAGCRRVNRSIKG